MKVLELQRKIEFGKRDVEVVMMILDLSERGGLVLKFLQLVL